MPAKGILLEQSTTLFQMYTFWHDLFHGFTHNCGECYKSTSVCGLTGINGEICEQFNSYLQSIKYTTTHLSQSHFMFFTQFLYICGAVRKP